MRKSTFTIIITILVALIAVGVYWLFFYNKTTPSAVDVGTNQDGSTGFSPFGRGTIKTPTSTQPIVTTSTSTITQNNPQQIKLPKLRQLSTTPVSGMFASTTKIKSLTLANTTIDETIVRFIDRGAGHIFEANSINTNIDKISNTTLPKIYEGYWNNDLTKMVVRYLKDDTDVVTNFYSELQKVASSTASSTTPYEIRGRYMSSNIDQVAVSPLGDKIFTWNIESGDGVGYVSSFDEKNKIKIIDTPLTKMNIDWPEASTVTVTTRGSGLINGYSYSANTKTGEINKILNGIRGLSVKMSRDAKNMLYSIGGTDIKTKILNTKTGTTTDVIFGTLADKCVWSTLKKNQIYCAVPTEIPTDNLYPDDWYKGNVSFVDQIWQVDATTGEVHNIANPLFLSKQLIDATQLTLDPKENYLYFINKRDLTLWMLDLNQ